MPQEESNRFIKGALILTGAAFLVKLLSAVYRVPFQNIVGDVGFYISPASVPHLWSCCCACYIRVPCDYIKISGKAKGQEKDMLNHTLQVAFFILLLVGLCLFSLLFFGSKVISGLMGDPLLSPLIRLISFIFLLLPFFSVWRGYFQGVGNMIPTAASQIAEQVVRVACIILVSAFLIRNGYSLYDTGTGAIAGSIIGGIVGIGLLAIFAARQNRLLPLFGKGLSFREFLYIRENHTYSWDGHLYK